MADRSNDIIRYKKGLMTPAEMHALEREALNDPFLADALEGFDSIDADSLDNDLLELDKRFNKKKKTIVINWPLRIAASFLLIASAFWMISYFQNSVKEEKLSLQTPSPLTTDSLAQGSPELSTMAEQPLGETRINENAKSDRAGATEKPSEETSLDLSGNETMANANGATSGPVTLTPPVLESKPAPTVVSTEDELQNSSAIEAKKELIPTVDQDEVVQRKKAKADARIITGKVTSAEDGTPLPGVNVVVKGTSHGSISDVKGNYELSTSTENPTLVFSFIGFQSKEVIAKENSIDVQLGTDATQLSEVVVVGYGLAKSTEPREPVIKLADPIGGRKAYDNYLKTSLRYPPEALENKIKGRVTLQFTVRTDGTLDEFNVLKGLGYGCDEEVIRLVKEGPKWNPTTEDDVPIESEVRVKVRFSLPD